MKLAVYGTLKKGFHNHRVISDAIYQGSCWVDNFGLADEGYYPSAFKFPGRKIWVEVYDITGDMLAATDRLEGVRPDKEHCHYTREQVETHFGPAFMYARLENKLEESTTKWFPDGIWEGGRSRLQPWLGWKTETLLATQAMCRRLHAGHSGEDKLPVPYVPQTSPIGLRKKVWSPEKDDWEYVPAAEAVGRLTEKPTTPTRRELAQAMIKEGLEKGPKLPEEQVG